MARVRVYVYYDVERTNDDWAVHDAMEAVKQHLNGSFPGGSLKRVVFGATLLPNETVLLPTEGAEQLIRVRER